MTKEQEKLTKIFESAWKHQTQNQDEQVKHTHDMKTYSFSVDEARQLAKIDAAIKLANSAVEDILNNNVLKRLGYEPNPELKMLYDITLKRIAVWAPKTQK